MALELETINKLYLELSNVATATTGKEAKLINLASRLAATLFSYHDTCPECGNTGTAHMAACKQIYAKEFRGPADFERVFRLAFLDGK